MDEKITSLNLKISEMASEFADMLKDTLNKMQDRVEFASKEYSEADTGKDLAGKFENAILQ